MSCSDDRFWITWDNKDLSMETLTQIKTIFSSIICNNILPLHFAPQKWPALQLLLLCSSCHRCPVPAEGALSKATLTGVQLELKLSLWFCMYWAIEVNYLNILMTMFILHLFVHMSKTKSTHHCFPELESLTAVHSQHFYWLIEVLFQIPDN